MINSKYVFITLILLHVAIVPSFADLNEEISFTNYADESLYIELYVEDYHDWVFYDLYVDPGQCSYADFWTETPYAAYSVCAYGEFTDDFYGCIEGEVNDWDTHVVFDNTGYPYLSTPPEQSCDIYYYETSGSATDIHFADHDDDGDVYLSCFIGTLSAGNSK